MEFINNLFQSETFRYFAIMMGLHVVLGMFGIGCCSRKKKDSKNKSCH